MSIDRISTGIEDNDRISTGIEDNDRISTRGPSRIHLFPQQCCYNHKIFDSALF